MRLTGPHCDDEAWSAAAGQPYGDRLWHLRRRGYPAPSDVRRHGHQINQLDARQGRQIVPSEPRPTAVSAARGKDHGPGHAARLQGRRDGAGVAQGRRSGWQKLGNGTVAGGKLPTSIRTLTDPLGATPAIHDDGVPIRDTSADRDDRRVCASFDRSPPSGRGNASHEVS
jgi:hypothetical protein